MGGGKECFSLTVSLLPLNLVVFLELAIVKVLCLGGEGGYTLSFWGGNRWHFGWGSIVGGVFGLGDRYARIILGC